MTKSLLNLVISLLITSPLSGEDADPKAAATACKVRDGYAFLAWSMIDENGTPQAKADELKMSETFCHMECHGFCFLLAKNPLSDDLRAQIEECRKSDDKCASFAAPATNAKDSQLAKCLQVGGRACMDPAQPLSAHEAMDMIMLKLACQTGINQACQPWKFLIGKGAKGQGIDDPNAQVFKRLAPSDIPSYYREKKAILPYRKGKVTRSITVQEKVGMDSRNKPTFRKVTGFEFARLDANECRRFRGKPVADAEVDMQDRCVYEIVRLTGNHRTCELLKGSVSKQNGDRYIECLIWAARTRGNLEGCLDIPSKGNVLVTEDYRKMRGTYTECLAAGIAAFPTPAGCEMGSQTINPTSVFVDSCYFSMVEYRPRVDSCDKIQSAREKKVCLEILPMRLKSPTDHCAGWRGVNDDQYAICSAHVKHLNSLAP